MNRFEERFDNISLDWFSTAERVVVILIILFLFVNYGIGLAKVNGDAMSPTIGNGDIIIYLKFSNKYKKGDLVALRMNTGDFFVRRIVATGEQYVGIDKDGRVLVDGEPEEYLSPDVKTAQTGEGVFFPLKVPQGRFLVLGDNREETLDSRSYGVVSRSSFMGKVLFIFHTKDQGETSEARPGEVTPDEGEQTDETFAETKQNETTSE